MRVLLTRPHGAFVELAALLAARNVQCVSAPLLHIEFIAGDALDLSTVQALVFTSANGVQAFAYRSPIRTLAALCVGDATARAARAAGFVHIQSASGNVDALVALVKGALDPGAGAVLHPAGTKLAGDLGGSLEAAAFTYRREVLYTALKAKILPDTARQVLEDETVDGVLFYSPRTAEAFCTLVAEAKLCHKLATVTAYCLSSAVADIVVRCTWRGVEVAPTPDQDALLALLSSSSAS